MHDFIKRDPYHVRPEPHPDGTEHHFRGVLVEKHVPPFREWGLIVGDIVHNLRSSLDNLAYALQVAHSGRPDETKTLAIQFPICDNFGFFEKERERRLSKVAPDVQAIIETLQPYHRADPKYRHPLSVLRDLANVDKHRRLLLVFNFSPEVRVTATYDSKSITQISGYSGPLEDGAIVAAWTFDPPPQGEVKMHYSFTYHVLFPNEWPAWLGNVPEVLEGIADHIENAVFPALERLP